MKLAIDVEFEAVLMAAARRDRLDKAIEKMAADTQYTPVVRRLCCLRGVSTLTGLALAVEAGHWYRFSGPTTGAHLVLVPTELEVSFDIIERQGKHRGTFTSVGGLDGESAASSVAGTTAPNHSSEAQLPTKSSTNLLCETTPITDH